MLVMNSKKTKKKRLAFAKLSKYSVKALAMPLVEGIRYKFENFYIAFIIDLQSPASHVRTSDCIALVMAVF